MRVSEALSLLFHSALLTPHPSHAPLLASPWDPRVKLEWKLRKGFRELEGMWRNMAGSPLLWGGIKCYLIAVGKGSFCYLTVSILVCFFFFLDTPSKLWDLSFPLLGIELRPLAVRGQSCNHWTAREFPMCMILIVVTFSSCMHVLRLFKLCTLNV